MCDRPRAPQRSPRATPREVISKILYLRQRYHFGPGKIADYLQRFHQLKLARSSVHRVLIRHGLNLLPANQKRRPAERAWQRYEKPQPGHHIRPRTPHLNGKVERSHRVDEQEFYQLLDKTALPTTSTYSTTSSASGRTTTITTDRTEPSMDRPIRATLSKDRCQCVTHVLRSYKGLARAGPFSIGSG